MIHHFFLIAVVFIVELIPVEQIDKITTFEQWPRLYENFSLRWQKKYTYRKSTAFYSGFLCSLRAFLNCFCLKTICENVRESARPIYQNVYQRPERSKRNPKEAKETNVIGRTPQSFFQLTHQCELYLQILGGYIINMVTIGVYDVSHKSFSYHSENICNDKLYYREFATPLDFHSLSFSHHPLIHQNAVTKW